MSEPAPTPTEPTSGSHNPVAEPVEPAPEPDTFPREYVEQLRRESADNRKAAQMADTLRTALQDAYLREASTGILREPLPWSDDYTDAETGLPDAAMIKSAAEALAADKPWLSLPRGDIGQGFRGEQSDAVSLADMLRVGA